MAFERISAATSDAERFARLWLARTPRVGPVTFDQLMLRFGSAEKALAALPDLVRKSGGTFNPPKAEHVEEELRRGQAIGAALLLAGDAAYPSLLRQADGAPAVLWKLGPLPLIARAVALVGARNASAAGQKMAETLARDLSAAGIMVVSGMARGIDARAHDSALGATSGTAAVLGGGVDDVYPPENSELYARLVERGAILSESPVGYGARAQDFPRRNRIISGLSLAVVVVEAELRSGSLITARLAAEQNREVFAVPGSPLDPRARGCNDLLRQGAQLCENADDVLRALDARAGFDEPGPPDAFSGPGPAESDIARAVMVIDELLGPVPMARDELIRLSGLGVATALAALCELEVSGRADLLDGGVYVRA